MPSYVSASYNQDVAGSSCQALIFHRFDELRGGDLVTGYGRGWVAVFVFVPAEPVD